MLSYFLKENQSTKTQSIHLAFRTIGVSIVYLINILYFWGMKARLLILFISLLSSSSYSQCFSPTTVFSSNINYYSADVNWNSTLGTHHYRIRFKEVGTTNWFYRTNIDSTQNSILLNNLLPQSYYIWQIRSQCDSLNITFAPLLCLICVFKNLI